MKGRLLPMLVMVFAISGLLFSAVPADSSDATSDEGAYVSGLICEIGLSGPTPANGVEVTLTYMGHVSKGKTNSDGVFKIKISDDATSVDTSEKVYFKFTKDGYSIFTIPNTMDFLDSSTTSVSADAEIDLSKITPVEGVYTATNGTQHCILLGDTYVPVTITVINKSTGVAVRNAEITLTNGDTVNRGTSNYNGEYTFNGILIGTYDLVIKCDGYSPYKETVNIEKKTGIKWSYEMEQKEPSTYLGLTLYHLLMILGVTVGLCLVVISYVLCKRTWRNVDKSDVENN